MNKMDIVIISEFCEDFSLTDNDRFLYLAKLLSKENDVEIITSAFRHTTKKHRNEAAAQWPFIISFIEEPGYPKNICLQRFKSHHIWGKNVIKYLMARKKPDVVYCAVPSLTGPNLVSRYCEKNQIRFIIDVQDLWPEAFQMVFPMPVFKRVFFAPFKVCADGIYKRADAICAVSDTYCQRALSVNQKTTTTTTVFLGTDLSVFDRFAEEQYEMKKGSDEIWLAYCGTLGSSYDINCVIDALSILNNPKVYFIVMGDGPKRANFEAYAKEKACQAIFTGRLHYNEMCSIIKMCDITVNPIVHNAAASIINKHADYAASGLPVINTQESEEYRSLIDTYQMGFNCKNNDANDLADKIRILISDPLLRKKMGMNARKCAEEKFDRKNTYPRLISLIMAPGRQVNNVAR